ncbi:MAG: hypothetical protein M9939_24865 [Mesorhizobium sp.]|nr:hypothetical protein [Mesorhizobium sp.]MCO5164325.1 hypothetical protein [Mesorhizobium sp.]
MVTSRKVVADGIVTSVLCSVVSSQPKFLESKTSISSLGINGTVKRILGRRFYDRAEAAGYSLDEENLGNSLPAAKTVGDLRKVVEKNLVTKSSTFATISSTTDEIVLKFGSPDVMMHVIIVISKFKNIIPSLIKPSDDLSKKWKFDSFEKRAISQSINKYFQINLNHKLTPQIHPSETASAVTVADLGQITFNHL